MKLIHLSRGFLSMTVGLAAVLGAASAARADLPSEPGDVPRSSLAPADYKIVKTLHSMGELGVSAGTLAQKNGGSQAVKDFGATLASSSTTADQQILAYAKRAGIDPKRMRGEPPPDELKRNMQSLDRLRALNGQQFDREFAVDVRDAIAQVIALIDTTLPSIADPNLSQLLRNERLPVLEKNYQTAATLAAQLEASSSAQPNSIGAGQPQQPAPSTTR